MKGYCSGEKPLSFGGRPWCDMPAAASNSHSRLSRGPRMHATVLAVCGEEAQHARLRRARAVPRGMWSVHALGEDTAPAGSLPRSVQDRGATCQLPPQFCTAGFRAVRARAPMRWLSMGRRRKTRACRAHAPYRAGSGRSTHRKRTLHQRETFLLRCKTVLRRASCGLQCAAGFRVTNARARHCAGCLSGGSAIHALAARAPRRADYSRHTH